MSFSYYYLKAEITEQPLVFSCCHSRNTGVEQQIFEVRANHILLYKAKISLKLAVPFVGETIRITKLSCSTKLTTYVYKKTKTRLDKDSCFSMAI